MPRVAYSEAERKQIRQDLIQAGLDLMAEKGIQHTTVEQVYKKVGISRSFFYSFFPSHQIVPEEAYNPSFRCRLRETSFPTMICA